MPIYEYLCTDCRLKYSVLVGMTAETDDTRCPKCGKQGARQVSHFKPMKTEDDRMESIADRLERMGEPDSPTEMRRTIREIGKALEEDVSDDMEELYEADMDADSEVDDLT